MDKKRLAMLAGNVFAAIYRLRYGKRVRFGKNVVVGPKFSFKGKGRLTVGEGSNLWCHKEPLEVHTYSPSAEVIIGKNCRINGAGFFCRDKIEIGDGALIGSAVIMDTDFHSIDPSHRNDPAHVKTLPVKIGSRAWIAGQAAVLKGVTIGDNSVIGFRAVVASDIPSDSVVAGNPARVIKSLKE